MDRRKSPVTRAIVNFSCESAKINSYQVFAFVVRKLDFLELAVNDGGPFKIWGWLLDLRSHLDMPDQVEKRKGLEINHAMKLDLQFLAKREESE